MSVLGFGARSDFKGLWDGLAVAGQTGTLADELRGSALNGKLRAKTGSLDGVSGLAGYLDGRRALSFALLANGNLNDAAGRLHTPHAGSVPQPGSLAVAPVLLGGRASRPAGPSRQQLPNGAGKPAVEGAGAVGKCAPDSGGKPGRATPAGRPGGACVRR